MLHVSGRPVAAPRCGTAVVYLAAHWYHQYNILNWYPQCNILAVEGAMIAICESPICWGQQEYSALGADPEGVHGRRRAAPVLLLTYLQRRGGCRVLRGCLAPNTRSGRPSPPSPVWSVST
jgi:hypothetical protein